MDEHEIVHKQPLPERPGREEYLLDPCRASSLPFWKTSEICVPENMKIVREDAFSGSIQGYRDTPYFKLKHTLRCLPKVHLPSGFSIVDTNADALSAHIAECYQMEWISAEALERYRSRKTWFPGAWIAIADDQTGRIVASGIAEADTSIGEGILEWIQVSPEYRRRGLGKAVVSALLARMKRVAAFVTVSGRMEDRSEPYALYRACGFTDPVIWHILRRDEA